MLIQVLRLWRTLFAISVVNIAADAMAFAFSLVLQNQCMGLMYDWRCSSSYLSDLFFLAATGLSVSAISLVAARSARASSLEVQHA